MLKDLIRIFLPRTCHLCGRHLIDGERGVCTGCIQDLPRTLFHRIPDNAMELRFAGFFPFERASAHFFYSKDGNVSRLIWDIKYHGYPSLGHRIGEIVAAELLPTGFFSDVDGIVPVPMHWLKKARRGYNQARIIAEGMAGILGVEVVDALKAVRPHRTQTSLSAEQRRLNPDGLFAVKPSQSLAGRHLLLVDDVCTTGATMRSAAMALHTGIPGLRLTILAVAAAI